MQAAHTFVYKICFARILVVVEIKLPIGRIFYSSLKPVDFVPAFQVVYTKLQDLGSTSVGSGRFMFNSNDKLCSDQNCFDYHVGLFEVRLRDPGMATKRL